MASASAKTSAAPAPSLRPAAQRQGSPQNCCGKLREFMNRPSVRKRAGHAALVLGNEQGICCIIEMGIKRDTVFSIFSASKILTAYVFLKFIEEGRLTLHTRAADVLDWWKPSGGGCHNVTVGHLLTQTGSLARYRAGIGQCTAASTVGCAEQAYREACTSRPLGSAFQYAETNWQVLGAIALRVTGMKTYNSVFRKYLGNPLRMSKSCAFNHPTTAKADPGAGANCSTLDYARFLQAALRGEIVPRRLWRLAELPQTLQLDAGGTIYAPWEYGIGQWRECAHIDREMPAFNVPCTDSDGTGVKVSSIGVGGFYPWIFRRGNQSHWGILARNKRKLGYDSAAASIFLGSDLFPYAVAAIERLAPRQPAPRQPAPSPLPLPVEFPPPATQALQRPVQRAVALLGEEGGPTLALGSVLAACLVLSILGFLWRLCFGRRRKEVAFEGAARVASDEPPAQKIGGDVVFEIGGEAYAEAEAEAEAEKRWALE